jgi:hypothetical protein
MVPGHASHSALGAFHPTPIASSRTSAQPTALRRRRRRAGIRRRVRRRSRRRTKTTPERSTPPSERGTTTSTHTPTETSRDRGTPTPPPAPPPHPRRRRDAATTRRKTTRSTPERSTPPPACGAITSTRIPTTTSHGRGTPKPPPAPPPPHPRSRPRANHDRLRGKPDCLPEAHGPSAVALQQRCHRASAPARRPSWPPMPRPRPQRPQLPGESRIRSPLRNRIFVDRSNTSLRSVRAVDYSTPPGASCRARPAA